MNWEDLIPTAGAFCRIGPNAPGETEVPLAMVYAPRQDFDELYDPEKGLMRGTVFTRLDLPFLGDGGGK